ncbi:hypothetical protein RUM43_012884 [Polyplax serrata]|uniref:von Hippel-Lindau disease tumour suppressor beta domain-containing protein n=1 Tax=Polyplax serrata TaxID=468196 RepID=A0AAN8PIG1_POLSC
MLPIRSVNYTESAYVQFQNKTNRKVDILWVNYVGDLKKYGTLQPHESVNVDTYKTHPWIFIDPETGVKMKVGASTIFYPISNAEVVQRLRLNTQRTIRIPIPIRLPLFTLQQISLHSVFSMIKDINDIENLELPLILKQEILKFHQEKNEIISKYEW